MAKVLDLWRNILRAGSPRAFALKCSLSVGKGSRRQKSQSLRYSDKIWTNTGLTSTSCIWSTSLNLAPFLIQTCQVFHQQLSRRLHKYTDWEGNLKSWENRMLSIFFLAMLWTMLFWLHLMCAIRVWIDTMLDPSRREVQGNPQPAVCQFELPISLVGIPADVHHKY